MATNQAHSHGNSFAEKKKKKKEGFAWQCHTRQIKDNRTDLLKQNGLQIRLKLLEKQPWITDYLALKMENHTGETATRTELLLGIMGTLRPNKTIKSNL